MENEKVLLFKKAVEMLDVYVEEMKLDELSKSTINKYLSDINHWLKVAPEVICKDDMYKFQDKHSIVVNDC